MAGVSDLEHEMPDKLNLLVEQPATYETTAHYFKALENWLQCVRSERHTMAVSQLWSYYYCLQLAALSCPQFVNNSPQAFLYSPVVDIRGHSNQTALPQQRILPVGRQFRLAPVWKRCAAQVIDLLFLGFTKLIVGLAVAFIFRLMKWNLFGATGDWDVKVTLESTMLWLESDEITPDLIFLEIANVLLDTVYETIMMQMSCMNLGKGQTLGKAALKIRVIECRKATTIVEGPEGVVLVEPGTDVKFVWGMARSFIKNIVLSMLLPVTFVLFFFKHCRTGYDVLCHTVVVEDRR